VTVQGDQVRPKLSGHRPDRHVHRDRHRTRIWRDVGGRHHHHGHRAADGGPSARWVVSSEITGQILLPFFNKPVEVELSFDLKGNISIGLKGADGGVLAELTKEDIISMKINSFAFSSRGRRSPLLSGGAFKPLFGGGLDIPEFGVNSLIVEPRP